MLSAVICAVVSTVTACCTSLVRLSRSIRSRSCAISACDSANCLFGRGQSGDQPVDRGRRPRQEGVDLMRVVAARAKPPRGGEGRRDKLMRR